MDSGVRISAKRGEMGATKETLGGAGVGIESYVKSLARPGAQWVETEHPRLPLGGCIGNRWESIRLK